MRRIVFIGCGGSGNAVIGYLMDQLKAALREYGHHSLPETWQFLVIDARHTAENLPDNLGTVRDLGADYQSVSPASGSYQVVDETVARRALDDLATWAPRDPGAVTTPIQDGAGQMRSVGRVLLASRARVVADALAASAEKTKSTRARSDARALESICGPLQDDRAPMAIVVTSMAGGSGASMALDVCRLLEGSYDVATSALLAFTPDVFDSIPPNSRSGVRPNSLAMLGEIVAMQMGQGVGPDTEFMGHLGLTLSGGDVPIRRVIPVGRYASDGTPFGDGTMEAVYRALGSALAALVISSPALETYVKQVIENSTPTPAPGKDLFGWGAAEDAIQWGTFGYASLSMGRERYKEYAAQRLARSAAEHLLRGHLLAGDEVPGDVQVQQRLEDQLRHVRSRVGLPAVTRAASPSEIEATVKQWLSEQVLPTATVRQLVRPVLARDLVEHLPERGEQAADVVTVVRNVLRSRRTALAQQVEDIAYSAAYDWHQGMVDRIEAEVSAALALHGAVYARAVLDEIGQQLGGAWGEKALRDLGDKQPQAQDTPADVQAILGRLVGVINDLGASVIEPLRQTYGRHLVGAVYGRFAQLAADGCADITKGVVQPLRESLTRLINDWEREVNERQSAGGGLSVTQTDVYRMWPSDEDEKVPRRWFTAQNEVLLTDPAIFADRYTADLVAGAALEDEPAPTFPDSRARSVARVLSGDWPTTAGEDPPGTPLVPEREFVSRTFQIAPSDPAGVRTSQPAIYTLGLAPTALLQRARSYVDRPDASFSVFAGGSIKEFATTPDGAAAIKRGFGELLSKAQPLAQVDEHSYIRMHGDTPPPAVTYSFSDVPFDGMALVDDLTRSIQDSRAGANTEGNLLSSLTGNDLGHTKISAFGFFPPVVPPVLDNILKPVRDQWASAKVSPASSQQFWSHRRARPLTGSLALSKAERQAMVGGWLVGQITGHIRIPAPPYHQPVRVYDVASSRWVDFPHPLLYPPAQFRRNYEWLPAVLESHLLAVADFGVGQMRGASMQPYGVLRRLWDNGDIEPTKLDSGMFPLHASRLLHDWLETGDVPAGGESRCAAASREERLSKAQELLVRIEAAVRGEAEPLKSAADRRQAAVFRDLAKDLEEIIPTASRLLASSPTGTHLPDDVF